ncbi:SLC13 family permease [Xanthobacter tagetidis]|uniref:Transporter n=1 Tax=Xanthobacter tagetidis TaxID=60216 RepID=A0A3L7A166_9HYPH|nr:SLC13 family permease [Xanthobacter tagetidis]MBB6307177.1 Na+/H+ antiporter NhaD/arsenite permease-like protein [Xanthobacter tagetidis]RLP74016.1 transporter [Xanthobacter tagetidis]
MDLTLTIFVLVYVAMGVGHLPFFRLDRTGAALVGAMLLIALGIIAPAAAWQSIDYNALGLLAGLMIISAAFSVSGFYDYAARAVGAAKVGPQALLAIVIAVSAGLSALLTNDVVVVAMTPIFCQICLARRLNPVPFLLAFCFAANVGSSATLIGSPQNMIAAETLHLSFLGFMKLAALPSLVGLPVIWGVLVLFYRGRWELAGTGATRVAPPQPLDVGETVKAFVVTAAVIVGFVATDWPHMLIALLGASILLVSRRVESQKLIGLVDGDLLVMLIGLFIVNAAVAATGLPQELIGWLRSVGFNLHDPMSMLIIMSVVSNIVGNNPAVMLAAPFLTGAAQPEALGAAIALGTGFSSNAVIFGSLAGIIVAEQGKKNGITIGFAEFAKAGVPTSLLCLLLAAGWILYLQ